MCVKYLAILYVIIFDRDRGGGGGVSSFTVFERTSLISIRSKSDMHLCMSELVMRFFFFDIFFIGDIPFSLFMHLMIVCFVNFEFKEVGIGEMKEEIRKGYKN